ncbi:MAG: DUF2971 domain-containing protein [Muribaculaceae bacterium]|nr:DUF2971 domain-containing protein [Muribaculaceae bacterium]
MEGISNISDAKSFFMYYKTQRENEVFLYSIDIETGDLSSKTVKIPMYDKINALQYYLFNRDYDNRGPLTGLDLKNNGFGDLLGTHIPSGIAVTDWHHNSIDQYAISCDTVINAGILSSRLVRIEAINALLPHLKKGERYKYKLHQDPIYTARQENIMRSYTEFVQFANTLSERHPYVQIYRSDYAFDEFFPKTYICINGRPYIVFRQGNMASGYQDARSLPCYDVMDCFYENNCGKVWDIHNQSYCFEGSTSLKEVLNNLFNTPTDYEKTKVLIAKEFKSIFGKDLNNKDIFYDWVKKCYCLAPDMEDVIFGECAMKLSKEKYFCKYTSLDTLMAVLKSENMRLNSIVSMNDPTEILKLKGEGCNYMHSIEEQEEILKYANYYYITSFTKNQDDLNMWRFYGEKGTGVCMVFMPIKDTQEDVFDVTYVDLDSNILSKIDAFLSSLEKKAIRFSIQSYVDKYLFIKPKEYDTENERRLVIASNHPTDFARYSNNIVTPFIDRKLPYSIEQYETAPESYFPLKLVKIILGPEMMNKEDNKRQINFMIDCKLPNFPYKIDVEVSKIKCYRN